MQPASATVGCTGKGTKTYALRRTGKDQDARSQNNNCFLTVTQNPPSIASYMNLRNVRGMVMPEFHFQHQQAVEGRARTRISPFQVVTQDCRVAACTGMRPSRLASAVHCAHHLRAGNVRTTANSIATEVNQYQQFSKLHSSQSNAPNRAVWSGQTKPSTCYVLLRMALLTADGIVNTRSSGTPAQVAQPHALGPGPRRLQKTCTCVWLSGAPGRSLEAALGTEGTVRSA